ncbi:MAG: hypothetical protein ACKV19_27760 [Verrucomicrobiales bacterium]
MTALPLPVNSVSSRVLFSPDGQRWSASTPFAGTGPISKVVIGSPPTDEETVKGSPPITLADKLSRELQGLLAQPDSPLTHLHVWKVGNLVLPDVLPQNLLVLDLRGCSKLEALPDLPQTLETLDVAGCSRLHRLPKSSYASIQFLHLDGRNALTDRELRHAISSSNQLCEASARFCHQIKHLDLPEGAPLTKLVLEGCGELNQLPALSPYPRLEHLNLNECGKLAKLGDIHVKKMGDGSTEGLVYFVNHQCNRLIEFAKMDVRPPHRSQNPDDNVAETFKVLQEGKGQPATLVMAKVLLLGSGRCGKSTTADALRWFDSPVDQRQYEPIKSFDPAKDRTSTHGIAFHTWQTSFDFSNSRGRERGELRGTAHIWDFGGQDIYHNTHRIFASSGSVFIIVTTDPDKHKKRVEEESSAAPDPKNFLDENEYKELKYWLDYIRNALRLPSIDSFDPDAKKVSLLILATGTNNINEAKKYLAKQAGPYESLITNGRLRIEAVDFKACNDRDFGAILTWVRTELGGCADGLGTKVPQIFRHGADVCEAVLMQAKSPHAFLDDARNPSQPLTWDDWKAKLKTQAGCDLSENAIAVATRFLHHCGRLHWLQEGHGRNNHSVVIDMQWAGNLIYSLSEKRALYQAFKARSHKPISENDLEEILLKYHDGIKSCGADLKLFFLSLIHDCNICVKSPDGWIAVLRHLLPASDNERIRDAIDKAHRELLASFPDSTHASFALHGDENNLLGQSDYRAVLAFVAENMRNLLPEAILVGKRSEGDHGDFRAMEARGRFFGEEYGCAPVFWNDGFIVLLTLKLEGSHHPAPTAANAVLLRIEWSHHFRNKGRAGMVQARDFDGGLFIQVIGPDAKTKAERLQGLLLGEGGPLEVFRHGTVRSDEPPDWCGDAVMPYFRGSGLPAWDTKDAPWPAVIPHDVGISYKSSQKDLVLAVRTALRMKKFTVFEYCYDDVKRDSLRAIYEALENARVILVVPSKDYFETPTLSPPRNLYCPVEMAGAIVKFSETSRPADRFFWLMADENEIAPANRSFASTTEIEAGAREILDRYDSISKARAPGLGGCDARTELDRKEDDTINKAKGNIARFLTECGKDQWSKRAISVTRSAAGWQVDDIVAKVKAALQVNHNP